MESQRGPGPDWNIQTGKYQPTGDPAESARRAIFGSLPSTGHLLWGSSFNENISEIEVLPLVSSAVWSDANSNSGSGSILLITGSNINDYAEIIRRTAPFIENRIGLTVATYPPIDFSGDSLTEIILSLECNFYGMDIDQHVVAQLSLRRRTIGSSDMTLKYRDSLNNWVDTGILIGDYFVNHGDSYVMSFWRNLKMVIDVSQAVPKYAYLDIDGRRFDLSSFTAYSDPIVVNRSFIFSLVYLRTYETISKSIWIDDMSITDNEP